MKTLTFTRGARFACALTLLCTFVLADAGAALAAGTNSTDNSFEKDTLHLPAANHITSGSASGSILRTIVGLAIVIGVIYGLYWILKQGRAAKNPATGYGLEQLASLPLGTGKSVTLVRVGDEVHLLGISEHGISGIRVYTEEQAYELGLPLDSPAGTPSDPNAGLPPVQRLVETVKRFTLR
jgi:flagellar protein FliO/FliZ